MVLWLPWLRSYNRTVDWKERYADVQHGSTSYGLSFDESRDSTLLQFQAAPKLDVLVTLSSSTWNVSPAGSPVPSAKEHTDLRSSISAKSDADALEKSETEDGITHEECSDMEISTSRCQSLSGRSIELISPVIKCFCAACLDTQCRSIQCTT